MRKLKFIKECSINCKDRQCTGCEYLYPVEEKWKIVGFRCDNELITDFYGCLELNSEGNPIRCIECINAEQNALK
jgi:hypothetical protein